MSRLAAFVALLSFAACSKPAAPPAEKKSAVEQKVAGSPTQFAVGQKAHCPVTGEEFVVSDTTVQVQHEGKYYAFCCAECRPTFEKDPAKFAKK